MKNNFYYIDIEVKPEKGSLMPDDFLGAFVNCYTFALSKKKAMQKAIKSLNEDCYKIVRIRDCYQVDPAEFDECSVKRSGEPSLNDIHSLLENDDVYYGSFFGWNDQEAS